MTIPQVSCAAGLHIDPALQAVIALREYFILGQAPGLKVQEDSSAMNSVTVSRR